MTYMQAIPHHRFLLYFLGQAERLDNTAELKGHIFVTYAS